MRHQSSMLRALLAALCIITIASPNIEYGNKTVLAGRPQGANLAMEYTTWHEHAYRYYYCRGVRGHVQATGFFQQSKEAANLGKYFGIGNESNSFIVGSQADITAKPPTAQIQNSLLIHDQTSPDVSTLAGAPAFNPRQEICGIRLDWLQDIGNNESRFFVKASAPFVFVFHDMRMRVGASTSVQPAGSAQSFTLEDLFAGKVSMNIPPNQQASLTKAKIDDQRSAGGLADLTLGLGYKFCQQRGKYLFMSADITIPTGNRPSGEYLFEPIYGNRRHCGLGASLDAGGIVWETNRATLRLLGAGRYTYLYENTEIRTFPVRGLPLSQYFLLGRAGQMNAPLVPAANVLTLPTMIKPGSMLDGMIMIAYNNGGFTIDAGYNLFWKDQETVHSKRFDDKTYGVAAANFDTSGRFGAPATLLAAKPTLLTVSDLDFAAITTPALFTSKAFAALGYSCHIFKKYPCSIGAGVSYEFATTNADIENYAVWGKAILSF